MNNRRGTTNPPASLIQCALPPDFSDARMVASLGSAALVRIAGRDAIAFAHAQFTSNVRGLAEGAWQWSAWLDAQGRARAVFLLLRIGAEELLAWQPLGEAATMTASLARFVMRAAVRIEAIDATAEAIGAEAVVPAAGRVAHDDGGWTLVLADGRGARLTPGDPRPADAPALAGWRLHDVDARLPLLPAAMAGEWTPQALDLESIDAIRFDKGCYPGQEIAARLHFRGGNKRHLHRATVQGSATVGPGDELFDPAGAVAGRILYVADSSPRRALGVLADGSPRTLTTAAGTTLLVD
jgi:folate-binding protein YgfZ